MCTGSDKDAPSSYWTKKIIECMGTLNNSLQNLNQSNQINLQNTQVAGSLYNRHTRANNIDYLYEYKLHKTKYTKLNTKN